MEEFIYLVIGSVDREGDTVLSAHRDIDEAQAVVDQRDKDKKKRLTVFDLYYILDIKLT